MAHAAWKPRIVQGQKKTGRGHKWEMVYEGLTETRNALRRENPLEAHSHLQFTMSWAGKGKRKKNTALVEPFASVVEDALDHIIKLVPRKPSNCSDETLPVYEAIMTLRRFIEREARVKAMEAARFRAAQKELSEQARHRFIVRAIEEAVERALGRR